MQHLESCAAASSTGLPVWLTSSTRLSHGIHLMFLCSALMMYLYSTAPLRQGEQHRVVEQAAVARRGQHW